MPSTALALGHSAKSPVPAGSSTRAESVAVQAGCCVLCGECWEFMAAGKETKLVFPSLSILCSRVTVPVIGASECQDTGLKKLA